MAISGFSKAFPGNFKYSVSRNRCWRLQVLQIQMLEIASLTYPHTQILCQPCSDFLFINVNTLTRDSKHIQIFLLSTTRQCKRTALHVVSGPRYGTEVHANSSCRWIAKFFIIIVTFFVSPVPKAVPGLLIRINYNLCNK